LTALLAALLAREGVAVVVHGTPTESARITTQNIWETLNWPTWGLAAPDAPHANALQAGQMVFIETASLNAQLKKLLDVRRTIGLRNSAHSLVKLMNPSDQTNALLISSYTHPEYALSMAQTLRITHQRALLLRGTEGECVADVRRQPQMDAWYEGQSQTLIHAQQGPLKGTPDLPSLHAQETARYIQAVLAGDKPTPEPIAQQVRATLTAFDL
jgi:anthranilate phosphoribosyltransferase